MTQAYFYNDESFNFNYGQAKAQVGAYEEAEEIFHLVQNEKLKTDYAFVSHLARTCKRCSQNRLPLV